MAEQALPRRITDTVETVVSWILGLLTVLSAALAVSIGLAVHAELNQRASEQARDRIPITAQLVEATYGTAPVGGARMRVPATVRWIAADGTSRQDETSVDEGQAAGAGVTVWLDSRGDPVGAPVSSSDAVLCGVVAGISVAGIAGTVLFIGWLLARRTTFALNARRWAAEWAAIEPQWRQELR